MSRLRAPLRLYILGVIAAGVLALAAATALPRGVDAGDALLIATLLVIATAAQLLPVHLSMKVKITAEDTATFAGALLLGPFPSMLVSGISTLLGLRFRAGRVRWYNRAFNTSVAMLGTGCASLTYVILAGAAAPSLAQPLPILAAAVVKYLLDSTLVALVVDLQLKREPLRSWWGVQRRDLPHYASLYVLGAIAAVSGHGQPWVFVVFAVPMGLVLLSMRESAKLREQTRAAILELADIIDLRDPYTHGHSQRVAALAERLARRLRLEQVQVDLVRDAARVHDIGKIGTNDLVLLKPGPLDDGERQEMERHAEVGHRLLRRLPEFWEGAELVLSHHERIDGRGYPRGLVGTEISLESSIISVADTYDAMTTDRPYRRALPWDVVRGELARERGKQWHERAVDAFIALIEEERAAALRAAEPATATPTPVPLARAR